MKFKLPFAACAIATILFFSLIAFLTSWDSRRAPGAGNEILSRKLDEIVGSVETIRYINASDSKVFYTFRGQTGSYELRYIDLETLKEHTVPLTFPIDEIDRWSPNRRLLLIQCVGDFKEFPGHGLTRPAWLMVLDTADMSVHRLGSEHDTFEENPVWCDDETLIFSATDLAKRDSRPVRYHVNWKNGTQASTLAVRRWKDLSPLHNTDIRLMRLGDDELAFSNDGMIFAVDLRAAVIRQLSFVKEESIVPRWLNPCVDTRDILYCGTRTNLPNRNLFVIRSPQSGLNIESQARNARLENESDKQYVDPLQLTQEHTYNGKWIQGGHGYIYIAVTNNSFLLAVRPDSPLVVTNLFEFGHVDNLMPNAAGDKVYAVATPEPGARS
jgi:hypothetical protein